VAIYLLSLAEMTGVDLQEKIKAKMAKSAARTYRPCRTAFSPSAAMRPASAAPP
jgi:hypothetical protein